jgi:hypothetical protein
MLGTCMPLQRQGGADVWRVEGISENEASPCTRCSLWPLTGNGHGDHDEHGDRKNAPLNDRLIRFSGLP